MREKIKIKKVWTPLSCIIFGLLIIYAILLFLPVFWSIISSVKSDYDFRHNMFGLPEKWMFDNYPHAFFGFFVEVQSGKELGKVYMTEQFFNSFLYAGGCALAATYVPCHVGYLTAKYRYKFSLRSSLSASLCPLSAPCRLKFRWLACWGYMTIFGECGY